mmetsp:Transcript_25687/g.38586  ORF Transcript_25687/g.38586 Transcript_25687/m.38586 type:complete len:106 (-) Transcript_25687:112-429(-)
MFCALLGIIPPSKRIWKHLQNEVTTINDTPLQWSNEHSFAPDDDKEGSPMTLLVTVNGHDSITPHKHSTTNTRQKKIKNVLRSIRHNPSIQTHMETSSKRSNNHQ